MRCRRELRLREGSTARLGTRRARAWRSGVQALCFVATNSGSRRSVVQRPTRNSDRSAKKRLTVDDKDLPE